MTPGHIDLKVVRDRIRIAAECVEALRQLPQRELAAFLADQRTPAAAESYLRRAIEALFDTTRHILSKALGLGALEYREVARHARKHGLVQDASLAGRFELIAGYRNRLTHLYEEVTPQELFNILRDDLKDLDAIAAALEAAAVRLAKKA